MVADGARSSAPRAEAASVVIDRPAAEGEATHERRLGLWRAFRTRAPRLSLSQSGLGWTGVDAAVPPNRLDRLLSDQRARSLLTFLENLPQADVEWLAACARVNARQAAGGFQRTAVLNLTAPFAVVFGLGQIFPESAQALVAGNPDIMSIAGLGLLAVIVCATVSYAFRGARAAETLADIADIGLMAKRASRPEPADPI